MDKEYPKDYLMNLKNLFDDILLNIQIKKMGISKKVALQKRPLFLECFQYIDSDIFPYQPINCNNSAGCAKQRTRLMSEKEQTPNFYIQWFTSCRLSEEENPYGNRELLFSFSKARARFQQICEEAFARSDELNVATLNERISLYLKYDKNIPDKLRTYLLTDCLEPYTRLVYLLIYCVIGHDVCHVRYELSPDSLPDYALAESKDKFSIDEILELKDKPKKVLDLKNNFNPYEYALITLYTVTTQSRKDFRFSNINSLEHCKTCTMTRTAFLSLLPLSMELRNQLLSAETKESFEKIINASREPMLIKLFRGILLVEDLKTLKGKQLLAIQPRQEHLGALRISTYSRNRSVWNQQHDTLERLYQSYCNQIHAFHESHLSAIKYEMNITISEYLNFICFNGYAGAADIQTYVYQIINTLIRTHNHDIGYMCILVESIQNKPILNTIKEEEIEDSIFNIFKDVENTPEYSYISGFSHLVATWAKENHKERLLRKLITQAHTLDHHIWSAFLSMSPTNIKIIQTYIILLVDRNQKHEYIRFARLLGFLSNGLLLKLYTSLLASTPRIWDEYIKRLHDMNLSSDRAASRGLAHLENVICNSKDTLEMVSGFPTVSDKESNATGWQHPLAEDFEKTSNSYLESSDDSLARKLLLMLPKVTYTLLEKFALIDLYNQIFTKLKEHQATPGYYQYLLYAQYSALNEENCLHYQELTNKIYLYISEYGCQEFHADCLEKLGDALHYYKGDDRNFYYELILISLKQLKIADEKSKKRLVQIFHLSYQQYKIENTIKLFIDEQKLQKDKQVYTPELCSVLRAKFLHSLHEPFMYPLLNASLHPQVFSNLPENLQLTLLHYASPKKCYRAKIEQLFKENVLLQDQWETLSTAQKACYIGFLEFYVEDYEKYPYLVTFIDEILDNIWDNQYIFKHYQQYNVESFRYHMISLLKRHPEKTAKICMQILGRIHISISCAVIDFQSEALKDQLKKFKLLPKLVANPCIRHYACYICKKILKLLYSEQVNRSACTILLNNGFPIQIIQNVANGIFPDWFGTEYPSLSNNEVTSVKKRCIPLHFSENVLSPEGSGSFENEKLLQTCEKAIIQTPITEPFEDFRWSMTVEWNEQAKKYEILQGYSLYFCWENLITNSFRPVTKEILAYVFEIEKVPPKGKDKKKIVKTDFLLGKEKNSAKRELETYYQNLKNVFSKKQLEPLPRKQSLCKLFKNMPISVQHEYLKKFQKLQSYLYYFDEIMFTLQHKKSLPTENIYAYTAYLNPAQQILEYAQILEKV